MSGRSMYKTKLCILYQKRGQCSRPNCTFAHGSAELRRPGDSSFSARRNNLDNDLRDKLDRRFSLERRHSSGRNGRGLPRFSGHDDNRPFEKRRDKDYRENQKLDDQGDYAGGLRAGNRIDDQAEDERNKFPGYNNVLEEQLKEVELDIKMLSSDKLRIGASIEEKAQEADILTSRIRELETQLEREKEECRRITSSVKKFVKEYNRFLRAQEDVKRSQARLQKLGNQLSTYLTGNGGNDRDAEIDIVNNEENNGSHHPRTAHDAQDELQNASSFTRKRHQVDQATPKEPLEDASAMLTGGGEEKVENSRLSRRSRWTMDDSKLSSEKETTGWVSEDAINEPSLKEDKRKRRRFSSGAGSGLVMPPTSMAAHAVDEVTEVEEENPEATKTVAANAEEKTRGDSSAHSQEES
ncbi:PREDICTED: zinc finger CCCH domain-containing protein 40 [Tarenaya hassleriana]|uniref:zinc finger CCCH domain-containing protein 40 n=1 Tax=Tarenaya hassleriana TaxID=28532 RepID=UPI0008FD3F6C|nr:PREDICTED: zinc finger CCCH domain-containing protein 40 [Tarenaya hassleriana]